MTACFADTFYFLAMLNPRDAAHDRVVQFNASSARSIVTTNWVLTELADALARTPNRLLFNVIHERLKADHRVKILDGSALLFDAGVELYVQRPDKEWSLTDCISFVSMKQNGLADALTGDHHFEQAGFRALLKAL